LESCIARGAQKDAKKISASGLRPKVEKLLSVLRENPYQPHEKLVGDLQGHYSRYINDQPRLVYQIYKYEKIVKIVSMWTHYE
jgi:toxin YoeB